MTNSISIRLLVKDHCSLTVILKSKLEKIYFFIHYTNLYTVYGYFRGGAQQIIQLRGKTLPKKWCSFDCFSISNTQSYVTFTFRSIKKNTSNFYCRHKFDAVLFFLKNNVWSFLYLKPSKQFQFKCNLIGKFTVLATQIRKEANVFNKIKIIFNTFKFIDLTGMT